MCEEYRGELGVVLGSFGEGYRGLLDFGRGSEDEESGFVGKVLLGVVCIGF